MSYKDIDIQIENFKRDMARIGAKSFMIDENRIEFAIPASKTILVHSNGESGYRERIDELNDSSSRSINFELSSKVLIDVDKEEAQLMKLGETNYEMMPYDGKLYNSDVLIKVIIENPDFDSNSEFSADLHKLSIMLRRVDSLLLEPLPDLSSSFFDINMTSESIEITQSDADLRTINSMKFESDSKYPISSNESVDIHLSIHSSNNSYSSDYLDAAIEHLQKLKWQSKVDEITADRGNYKVSYRLDEPSHSLIITFVDNEDKTKYLVFKIEQNSNDLFVDDIIEHSLSREEFDKVFDHNRRFVTVETEI